MCVCVCVCVCNVHACEEKRKRFFFPVPPNVTIQDDSYIVVNKSSSYQLSCQVSSIPVSAVSWYFNNSLLNNTTDTEISSNDITLDNGLVVRISVLTINNISKEQEGSYSCTGENGVANVVNTREYDTVFVFVQGKKYQFI